MKGEALSNSEVVYKESHIRSILKGLTWRIIASVTTISITYFITGEVETAVAVGGIEFVLKMVFYYIHERLWQMAPRGSVRSIIKNK